jgi:hypothetical protein
LKTKAEGGHDGGKAHAMKMYPGNGPIQACRKPAPNAGAGHGIGANRLIDSHPA